MKKYICFIILLHGFFLTDAKAQRTLTKLNRDSLQASRPVSPTSVPAEKKDTVALPDMYGWKIDARSGERISADVEKPLYNFHQSTLVDGQGIAVGYLGNIGSPAQSKIFFEREESSIFPFLDAFSYYHKKPEDHIFLNTKIPYSNILYQKAGGKTNNEERFKAELSSNFGKKVNVGIDIDYIYARGFYNYLSNKQITYDVYGSYISDRYQMHAFASNNHYNISENGGILDPLYITDPNNINLEVKNITDSKSIPTRITKMWNRLTGRQIFLSNRYNVGYDKELEEGKDKTEFIPVASFILTTRYSDQQRRIASEDNSTSVNDKSKSETDVLYDNQYYFSNTPIKDQMAYWSFKNTFAVTLNEGFRDWVKFGLTAYVEQDLRKFTIPGSVLPWPMIIETESQNSTIIGGMLRKEKGQILRYNLGAQFGILGANLGEMKLEGDISTTIKFAGQDAVVRAKAYLKNITPTFYQEKFQSKYFQWNNSLSDTRRVFVGGEIVIPHTKTRISGGVENIENHIYYGENKFIAQESENIQVVSVRLDQKLNAGIFHWDNQIAYQTSSNESVIPIPTLSAYTNVYLLTKLAKVLTIQLGADAHFHTKYYVPGYEPVTLQFYNQRETKIGGFPIATAYINIHLKKTRFFAMMYNVAESMGKSEYFSLPNYPVNPMIFKFGLSWDFSD